MACCKGENRGWCKDHPVVNYKDESGNEYCIFHAPSDQKGISVFEFNSCVYDEIKQAKAKNSSCNLSGTIFPGDIAFRADQVTVPFLFPPVRFDYAVFHGSVNFNDAVFDGYASFAGTAFNRDVNFFRSKFIDYSNFFGATFTENVYFSWASFKGLTWFHETKFHKKAAFDNAIISGPIEFIRTFFEGPANFLNTFFTEKVIFFASFSREAIFSNATFNNRALFQGLTFLSIAHLNRTTINEVLRFDNVNLGKVSLVDTDIRKIDFVNCTWPLKDGRPVLYDELHLAESWPFEKEQLVKIEILYRKLKQKYKEEHDESESSNWHFAEREIQRLRSSRKTAFYYLLYLYYYSSGYGEKPVRAVIGLGLLIMLFAVLFGLSEQLIQYNDWKNLPSLFLNTLQYATFENNPEFIPQTYIGAFLRLCLKLLIPLQAAFLALAVRNKFRR